MTLGLGMYYWGCETFQVCSYDDPRLTLTYLTSNFASYCIEMDFFEKWIIFKTVEALVIILTWYVLPNETMAINKFQMSRLTFDLSA